MLIYAFSIIFFLIVVYYKQFGSEFAKKVNKFPGPTLIPVFGDAIVFSLNTVKLLKIGARYVKTFKAPLRMWFGFEPNINIFTPEDIKAILNNKKNVQKGYIYKFLHNWMGQGLITSTGKNYDTHRKLLTPAFHFSILKSFVEIFNKQSLKIVEELKINCGQVVDISLFINRLTLASICETAMGIELDFLGEHKEYLEAVHKQSKIFTSRFTRPWYFYDSIFKLSPLAYQEKKNLRILIDLPKRVLKEREKNFQLSDFENFGNENFEVKKNLTFLDILLNAKKSTGKINDQDLLDEVATFIFAGYDTTATSVAYTLMLLANYRNIQDRVYQEIQSIFGDSNRNATYEDLLSMNYLGMVLQESLRKYPVIGMISRTLDEDLQLSNGIAPAGCMLNIHIFFLHRNENVWPDPEKFDPDRFLPESSIGRHPYSYIPFSAGPRTCIGRKYAMLQLKAIIVTILRNFILHPVVKDSDIIVEADLLFRSHTPITVKFEKRKNFQNSEETKVQT